MTQRPPKVLITGAGGPAAVSAIKALANEPVDLYVADIDPHAAGLQLLPSSRRLIVPPGAHRGFVPYLLTQCSSLGIDVLLPTVDAELRPLAVARRQFEENGTQVMVSSLASLDTCLDKWRLVQACAGSIPVPHTQLLTAAIDPRLQKYPCLVKPRTASGGRGVVVVNSPEELAALDHSGTLLLQQYLPGEEYSVDVLVLANGKVAAAVPRVRLKVDSGVAVAARTIKCPLLERLGSVAAEIAGITGVCNVQFKRDAEGTPRLLEINARLPGTMPLTIAAGVNMPSIWLYSTLGWQADHARLDYRELAMVRTWEEHYLPAAQFTAFRSRPDDHAVPSTVPPSVKRPSPSSQSYPTSIQPPSSP